MTRLFVAVGVRYFSIDMVRLCSQICSPCVLQSSIKLSLDSVKVSGQIRLYASDSEEHDRFSPKSVATLDAFASTDQKNKENYLDLLHLYKNRDIHRRGHCEFIYAALKYMKEFGVHKDLEAYKALIDVMPKGKFVAQNLMQAEFQHYPKQQQCIIDVLEEMEVNAVCPDVEMEDILINLFGRRSHVIRRHWRMMYWMPKLKNLSPWPVPLPLPDDSIELAKLAIQRITSVDPSTVVTVLKTKDVADSIDDTWIVSGQSNAQKKLIQKHKKVDPLYVEGSFRVWLKGTSVNYFILRADPVPPSDDINIDDVSKISTPLFEEPSSNNNKLAELSNVHIQEDSIIMAVCATGTSSRDSLLSWIRLLQRDIPELGEIPILFTLKSPLGETEPIKEIEEGDTPVPSVSKSESKT